MEKTYHIVADKRFVKKLKKRYNKTYLKKLLQYIIENIDNQINPRKNGFSLTMEQSYLPTAHLSFCDVDPKTNTKEWAYDIDGQRLVTYIQDNKVILIGLNIWPDIFLNISKDFDYENMIKIRELCNELGFSYNEFI